MSTQEPQQIQPPTLTSLPRVEDMPKTADGGFTLSTVECLGSCGTAPVVMVNETYHENLTPERLDALIERLAR